MKEQEFVGWAHHRTNSSFVACASVTEPDEETGDVFVDAVYLAVERAISPPPPVEAYKIALFDDSCHLFYSANSGATWTETETPANTLTNEWTDMQFAVNDEDYVNFLVNAERYTVGNQGVIMFGATTSLAALTSATPVNFGPQAFGVTAGTQGGDYAAYSTTANKIMIGPNAITGGGALIPRISNNGGSTWANATGLSSTNGWMGTAFNQAATIIYIHEWQGQIWKSNDGGSTWGVLGSSITFGSAVGGPQAVNTYRIRCNQAGNFVAVISGRDGGGNQGGQFYLSKDGGTTWLHTDFQALSGAQVNSVFTADFGMTLDGSKFVVMISGIDPDSSNYRPWVWVSLNGTSWAEIFPPFGPPNQHVGTTINISQDGRCIVLTYDRQSDVIFHADISTDGGTTWTTRTFGPAAAEMVTAYVFGG